MIHIIQFKPHVKKLFQGTTKRIILPSHSQNDHLKLPVYETTEVSEQDGRMSLTGLKILISPFTPLSYHTLCFPNLRRGEGECTRGVGRIYSCANPLLCLEFP